jgi:hypothetical protein
MATTRSTPFLLTAAVGLAVAAAAVVRAQPEAPKPQPEAPKTQTEAPKPQALDPMAQMQAYMAAMKPGPNHEKLSPLVGEWTVELTAWMQPGAPAMKMTGKSSKSWTLGGRFVHERVETSGPLGPSLGLGYFGYNNAKMTYEGNWLSDQSTEIVVFSGSASEDGKTFTVTGKESDPRSGGSLTFEMVTVIVSPDSHTLTFSYLLPGGQKAKAFEMVYTRVK